jgi:hypothetical protein
VKGRDVLLIAVCGSCAPRLYEFSDKSDVAALSSYEDIRLQTVFISERETRTIIRIRTASVGGVLWRPEGTDRSVAAAVAGLIEDAALSDFGERMPAMERRAGRERRGGVQGALRSR